MLTLMIFLLLLVLIMINVPIAVAMGMTAIIFFIGLGNSSLLTMLPQRMYASTTSFTLLAIPFFILAGNLMNTGGITNRIFRFAKAVIGHVPGGLGQVMCRSQCHIFRYVRFCYSGRGGFRPSIT